MDHLQHHCYFLENVLMDADLTKGEWTDDEEYLDGHVVVTGMLDYEPVFWIDYATQLPEVTKGDWEISITIRRNCVRHFHAQWRTRPSVGCMREYRNNKNDEGAVIVIPKMAHAARESKRAPCCRVHTLAFDHFREAITASQSSTPDHDNGDWVAVSLGLLRLEKSANVILRMAGGSSYWIQGIHYGDMRVAPARGILEWDKERLLLLCLLKRAGGYCRLQRLPKDVLRHIAQMLISF